MIHRWNVCFFVPFFNGSQINNKKKKPESLSLLSLNYEPLQTVTVLKNCQRFAKNRYSLVFNCYECHVLAEQVDGVMVSNLSSQLVWLAAFHVDMYQLQYVNWYKCLFPTIQCAQTGRICPRLLARCLLFLMGMLRCMI